ncbi:MAG: glutamyl-tRNA reductase [Gemmatimonadaceae bacterium]
MSIVAVGCSHSSAPLAVLEPLSIPTSQLAGLLARLKSVTREALVLSTCNRTELYAVVGHAVSGAELLLQVLAERIGSRTDDLRPHLYVHADTDAVRHALRVASGLDSMVLGEDQIQAQWKRALAHARVSHTLGPVLERLGAAALRCGKRIRTFTGIGRHTISLESLALRAAADRLGSLESRDILLIGTGESAGLIARHLRKVSGVTITVASRSLDKAEEFARRVDGIAVRMDDLPHVLTRADAVFCCTSAPHAVLASRDLQERVAVRLGAPLVCVDLGMPRDIDDSVASVAGTFVVSLHDLSALAETHREERRQHLPAAEAIVHGEVARFLEWQTARGNAATIGRLQAHAQEIAETELSHAQARLASLSPRDREVVTAMARRIVKKLMHTPIGVLKQHPEAENIALALECAFGLARATQALERHLPARPEASDGASRLEEAAS